VKPLLAAFAICCLSTLAAAQNTKPEKPIIIGEGRGIDGTNCEDTMAVLDLIAQTGNEEETIIIISRLGRGETSRNIVRHRLRNLREYLYRTRGIAKERIIVAEGERVRGLGKVEAYVGGELLTTFYMKRNRDFFNGCGV